MDIYKSTFTQLTILILLAFTISCNSSDQKLSHNNLVSNPEKMDQAVSKGIRSLLLHAANNNNMDDSSQLDLDNVVTAFYKSNNYEPIWSKKEQWQPLADSLYFFIVNAEWHGLFPKDYHLKNLKPLKAQLDKDSLKKMDPTLWAKADVLFTDAFMHILQDLKQGRLQPDSLSLYKKSAFVDSFFIASLNKLLEKKDFTSLLNSVQPSHKGYWELKKGIKQFLDSNKKNYTYVNYPYKKGSTKDSIYFIQTLQKRLSESNCIEPSNSLPDLLQLKNAIKKYQALKGLKADGKITASFIQALNTNDSERFNRIAITLDKYKQLPPQMPQKYIWVNLPGFYLWVMEDDKVVLESKIICGTPHTRTPLLTSKISDMITYPTWTVPTSIIAKQYLPRLKNNPNYLSRLGLRLIDRKGKVISGSSVNWSKYSRGIPYSVVQASGDNNSLGVMKFNFDNPYSVYLHDTNQRYLFKNSNRALSHGCVRVQEWEKLAFYIARNDSINLRKDDTLKYTTDSIKTWLTKKQRRRIDVKNHIPLYIRYFSCEGQNGKIKFYDDIYREDKALREKYLSK